jgi:hypothetical protein
MPWTKSFTVELGIILRERRSVYPSVLTETVRPNLSFSYIIPSLYHPFSLPSLLFTIPSLYHAWKFNCISFSFFLFYPSKSREIDSTTRKNKRLSFRNLVRIVGETGDFKCSAESKNMGAGREIEFSTFFRSEVTYWCTPLYKGWGWEAEIREKYEREGRWKERRHLFFIIYSPQHK